jgi:O-antigen ligase
MNNLNNLSSKQIGLIALKLGAIGIMLFLPFSIKFTSLSITLFGLGWLFVVLKSADIKQQFNRNKIPLILFILPFLLTLFGLLKSQNIDAGLFKVEKQLSLLLFPIFFSLMPSNSIKIRKLTTTLFVTVISMMYLYIIIHGIINMIGNEGPAITINNDSFHKNTSEWNYLTYAQLLSPVGMSAIYASMYLSFAIFILIYKIKLSPLLIICIILSGLILQLMTGSKMGIISYVIVSLIVIMRKLKIRYALGLLLLIIILFSLFIRLNPVVYDRLINWTSINYPNNISGWNSTNIRMALWESSLNIIFEHPIFGVGTGNAQIYREIEYNKYSFVQAHPNTLNSHNQFLESAVEGGILLLLSISVVFGIAVYKSVTKRDPLYLSFILIIIMCSLTESIFNTQKGVVFFSFFNSMFFFGKK